MHRGATASICMRGSDAAPTKMLRACSALLLLVGSMSAAVSNAAALDRGATQVGATQVGATQVGTAQVGASQAGASRAAALPAAVAYGACAACHGSRRGGLPAIGAPVIAGLDAAYVERQLREFATGSRGAQTGDSYGAAMRAAAAGITNDATRTALA